MAAAAARVFCYFLLQGPLGWALNVRAIGLSGEHLTRFHQFFIDSWTARGDAARPRRHQNTRVTDASRRRSAMVVKKAAAAADGRAVDDEKTFELDTDNGKL